MTINLLLNSEGKKMGKTASGAVWLDPNKTSPFEFYQYWRNVDDADVIKCLRMLTFLPLEEINAMADWKDAKLNEAKDILAYELTKLVHSEAEANATHMPAAELAADKLTDGKIGVMALLVECGLCASNSEARRLVQQGGVSINDAKVESIDASFDADSLAGEGVIIKKGKKIFHRAFMK